MTSSVRSRSHRSPPLCRNGWAVFHFGVAKSLSWKPYRPSMLKQRRMAWICSSAHEVAVRKRPRHRSTRLRHDVHQGGTALLDDDLEGALEGWPQGASIFYRSLGIYPKSARHRGEIHRRLI